MRRAILSATLLGALLTIFGAVVAPRPAQADGFAGAIAAMDEGEWDTAYVLALPAGTVGQSLVTWQRLRSGVGSFPEYPAFLAAHPLWPGLDRLREAGEPLIPGDAAPIDVIGYFSQTPPQTGIGVLRLVDAYTAMGQTIEAGAALSDAWLTLGLDDEGFDALIAAHADALAPLHPARADALLWRGRTTDASRLLPLMAEDQRLLFEARIALATGAGDRNARVAAVPPVLQSDPGLAYDRFNRMASTGDYSDAVALLTERSTSAATLGEPFRWASWRAALARWTMREGRAPEAYALANTHHLHPSDATGAEALVYADLEWLAGYIALTYLDDPQRALGHFAAVEAASSGPISLSRAGYWTGRAAEALGDAEMAQAGFARAAERLGRQLDPSLAGTEAFPDWHGAAFFGTDIGQAMLLMLDAGDRSGAVPFIRSLADSLDRTGLAQLGAMMDARDEPYFTVLVGKTAVARGIVLPAIYFPLHPMAETELPVPAELALSIARRESEFNFTVGSPVGALGLMQLMPATAREVATGLGLPYSRARLTSEWEYNAVLGTQYLAELTAQFGDSPVMIAAGYNAGPSRPRTWMTQRGDPRKGEVDVIDWIEHIPFTETRNYVMRVTESIPVYRARLRGQSGETNQTGSIGFTALLNGALPVVRPLARPAPAPTGVAPNDPDPGIRPVPRPGG